MALVDLIIISIIGLFAALGFVFGFVQAVGNIVGAIVGIFFASRLAESASTHFGLNGTGATRVVLFIVAFLLITRIVGVAFWVLRKVGSVTTVIPFAKTANRLLGLLFGLVEGVLVVAVVLFFAMQRISEGVLLTMLEASAVAKPLVALATALQVLFPESLRVM